MRRAERTMRPWLCSNDHPREAGGTVTHIGARTTIGGPQNYQLFSSIRPPVAQSRVSLGSFLANIMRRSFEPGWVSPYRNLAFQVRSSALIVCL